MSVSGIWCNTIFPQVSEKLFFKLTKKIFRFVFNIFKFFKTITSNLSFRFSFHQCSWSRCSAFLKNRLLDWSKYMELCKSNKRLPFAAVALSIDSKTKSGGFTTKSKRTADICNHLNFSVLSFLQFFVNLLIKTLVNYETRKKPSDKHSTWNFVKSRFIPSLPQNKTHSLKKTRAVFSERHLSKDNPNPSFTSFLQRAKEIKE